MNLLKLSRGLIASLLMVALIALTGCALRGRRNDNAVPTLYVPPTSANGLPTATQPSSMQGATAVEGATATTAPIGQPTATAAGLNETPVPVTLAPVGESEKSK